MHAKAIYKCNVTSVHPMCLYFHYATIKGVIFIMWMCTWLVGILAMFLYMEFKLLGTSAQTCKGLRAL